MNTCVRKISLIAMMTGIMSFEFPDLMAEEPSTANTAENFQTLLDFQSIEIEAAKKPLADLDAKHRADLEKLQKDWQGAGNLESADAAEMALKALEEGRQPLISENASVAALQKNHLQNRQAVDLECQKALMKLDQDYLAKFTKLASDLDQAGNTTKSAEVRAHADSVNQRIKAGGAGAIAKAAELAIWKKKALDEYPALADPKSALSLKVKSRVKELTVSNPSYLTNPQWPYLLAKEAGLALKTPEQAAEPDVPEKQIPRGAERFKGRKFFVYDETCSWKTAQSRCQALGGRLVVIPDEDTQLFVKQLAKGKNVWLGCSEPNNDGKWVWVDGTPMKYRHFGGKEPDNLGGHEQYLVMDAGGNWSDYDEKSNLVVGYVCEWTNRQPKEKVPAN